MTNQEDDLIQLFLLSFLGHMLSRRSLELLRHSRISLPTWHSLNNLELPKEPEMKNVSLEEIEEVKTCFLAMAHFLCRPTSRSVHHSIWPARASRLEHQGIGGSAKNGA